MRRGPDVLRLGGGRGEAQRVNIARAVLKNAPILLLDEATSSLDSFSESKVQRAIDRLAAGRMTIAVAHRLSTLRPADRVLVLEDGRVAGLGPHSELLASTAVYRRLWEAQATATPTTERLLKAFEHITLSVLHFPDHVLRHVTPLTPLQLDILNLLDLSPDIYRSLAKNSP